MGRILFFILFFHFACFASAAVPLGPKPLSQWGYADFTNLIDQREEQGRPFSSVAEFLSALPPGLKSHSVFLHTSLSLQGATLELPRAMAFTDRLVFTFNGDPDTRGFGTIEIMDFDSSKRSFEFNEIDFNKGKAEYSKTPPSICMGCHSTDPKPIWYSAPRWSGAFGGDGDDLTAKELGALKGLAGKVPYSKLNFKGLFSGKSQNRVFTQTILVNGAKRTLRKAQESEYFKDLQWVLMAAPLKEMVPCKESSEAAELFSKAINQVFISDRDFFIPLVDVEEGKLNDGLFTADQMLALVIFGDTALNGNVTTQLSNEQKKVFCDLVSSWKQKPTD